MKTTSLAFGDRMADARTARGYSLDDAAYHFRRIAPKPWRCSRASISRLERPDADESKVDPVILWILSRVYSVGLDELSPAAARSLGVLVPQGLSAINSFAA